MSSDRPEDYLLSLVQELSKLSRETEWLEFKVNEHEPTEIGEYLSALANSAALVGKAFAYLIWGITDEDHRIVPDDPDAAPKLMRYVPAWAIPEPRVT